MTKRAVYMVMIGGADVTSKLNPHLISLRVSDKVGTHSDTATIELDDTDGRLALPQDGVPVVIMLGWEGGGVRLVFTGTVDEVRSSGSRSGRTITVSAKGIDTKGKAKEPQQRHFDKKTIKDVLTEAGKKAGVTSVEVDPDLAEIKREYVEMRDESFIHLGERLAREIGGNFRVQGTTATMSKRMGSYTSFVRAAWGDNLHSWDITPALGRPAFKKTRARWYDRKEAKWKEQEVEVQTTADAESVARYSEPDEQQSKDRAGSDKATSERDVAEGSVTIEGDTGAIPDGLCIVSGTRAGIDGAYRIESVDHEYSRSGFTTKLELKSAGSEGGGAE
jgi:phage protein D